MNHSDSPQGPNSEGAHPKPYSDSIFFPGNQIGVLLVHGFTGSPASLAPWADYLAQQGFTVSLPRLRGHGTTWQELNHSNWEEWYEDLSRAFTELKKQCTKVFIAGFSVGGALALRLAEIHGNEIEGVIALNASIFDDRKRMKFIPLLSKFVSSLSAEGTDVAMPNPPQHSYNRLPLKALRSVQELWSLVERDLYLVTQPLLVAYSLNDHVVHPVCSETIINSVSSNIREVVFERSFHNVALDFDAPLLFEESLEFINDVLIGNFDSPLTSEDERELIDAEFESIVSGLSLTTSPTSDYLDELERIEENEKFKPELLPPIKESWPRTVYGLLGLGFTYLILYWSVGFDPLSIGSWPGVLSILGGIGLLIWRNAKPKHVRDRDPYGGESSGEFGDGSTL